MTASHGVAPNSHSSEEVPKRPKGILKNSSSYTAQQLSTSPEKSAVSPPLPADPAENKEITLQNTLQNAGRRSSSTRRASAGRRLSGTAFGEQQDDRASPHLKWDEANLYLAEQEKTAKMKIDEPKTPWAPSYDPAQDDDERDEMELEAQDRTLDAHDLVVDELDKVKEGSRQKKSVYDSEIPDLELGEPEEDFHHQPAASESRITRERSLSQNSNRSDKHVVVDNEEGGHDGEHLMTTEEAQEKHRQFEERRKRHYEMKNIKNLLAHPEEIDQLDDDDDEEVDVPAVPPVPGQVGSSRK